MKKKKRLALEWSFLAAAGIFFIFGRFIAPEYESKLLEFGIYEEVVPVSKYALWIAGVLGGLFLVCLIFRIFRKKA